jgi:hypothetical protein
MSSRAKRRARPELLEGDLAFCWPQKLKEKKMTVQLGVTPTRRQRSQRGIEFPAEPAIPAESRSQRSRVPSGAEFPAEPSSQPSRELLAESRIRRGAGAPNAESGPRPRQHRKSKPHPTRRTPGSPHSKKWKPLPPANPYNSIPVLPASNVVDHFGTASSHPTSAILGRLFHRPMRLLKSGGFPRPSRLHRKSKRYIVKRECLSKLKAPSKAARPI